MNNIIEQLKTLENFVDKNEESFLKHFITKGSTLMGLNGIWFGSENIRFYYITWDGMHIVGTISWDKFNKWKGTIKL